MKFEQAIEHVLSQEGGFTNNPKDAGNWTGGKVGKGVLMGTKYGISAASYPNEDIPNLTRARAKFLFHRDFWLKIRADELPGSINLHVFDFAVNAGIVPAVENLQIAAGVLADGAIGPKTLAAAKKVTPWGYAARRVDHYATLAKKKAAYREFLEGWMLRNLVITRLCLEN